MGKLKKKAKKAEAEATSQILLHPRITARHFEKLEGKVTIEDTHVVVEFKKPFASVGVNRRLKFPKHEVLYAYENEEGYAWVIRDRKSFDKEFEVDTIALHKDGSLVAENSDGRYYCAPSAYEVKDDDLTQGRGRGAKKKAKVSREDDAEQEAAERPKKLKKKKKKLKLELKKKVKPSGSEEGVWPEDED